MSDEANGQWPGHLPAVQVRLARPTDQLENVVRFSRDGLGLRVIGAFTGRAGYDGVMPGLPGGESHPEFTGHEHGSPGPAPSAGNLLMLCLGDPDPDGWRVVRMPTRGI